VTARPRCIFCGRRACARHHWTARLDPSAAYLDPDATVPVCDPCHHAEDPLWRTVGIDRLNEPLAARLFRLAWLLGTLADTGRPVIFDPETVRGLHRVVLRIIQDLGLELR
jgi:hypothetical protein